MKQNITEEQIYTFGISIDNIDKLGKLINRDLIDDIDTISLIYDYFSQEDAINFVVNNHIINNFTIGNMIEILHNHDIKFKIENSYDKTFYMSIIIKEKPFELINNELCDVLWEAIVLILRD